MKRNNIHITINETRFRISLRHLLNETADRDDEYMQAVQSGNLDKALDMVRKEFLKAYPATKVLDTDGLPKIVFHGSPKSFTKFKRVGYVNVGQYFTDNIKAAASYTRNNNKRAYLKPIKSATEAVNYLNANSQNQYSLTNNDDGTITVNCIDSECLDDWGYTFFEGDEQEFVDSLTTYGDTSGIYYTMLNITNPLIIDRKGQGWENISSGEIFGDDSDYRLDTNQIMGLFNYHNYNDHDGVIFANIQDGGGVVANDYVTINPNQIKSADPVVYDNNGDIIPLSQRFTDNEDIRYEEE